MTPYINHGKREVPIDPAKVEAQKNCKFVCEMAIRGQYGWTESPAQIYWQEKPPVEGYSNYFALVVRGKSVHITSGHSVAEIPISGVQTAAGEIIYSRYCHDYRLADTDKEVMIDGGRDYTRRSAKGKEVTLTIIDGEMVIVDENDKVLLDRIYAKADDVKKAALAK